MITHRVVRVAMVAVFHLPSLAAAPNTRRGAELARLHVAKVSDALARRLPGGAGSLQVLFERQTAQGTIGLIRLSVDRGTVELGEILRPEMEPELLFVLQGAIDLALPNTKVKSNLANGDTMYRPPRATRCALTATHRQPVRLLLWTYVPPPSVAIPPAEPIVRSANATTELALAGTKGSVKIVLDQTIAPKAFASLELLTLRQADLVREHTHQQEAEILFVTQGSGTLTIEGQEVPLTAGHAVYLPPEVAHSFKVTSKETFRAVQSYVPPGPEQRFKGTKKAR